MDGGQVDMTQDGVVPAIIDTPVQSDVADAPGAQPLDGMTVRPSPVSTPAQDDSTVYRGSTGCQAADTAKQKKGQSRYHLRPARRPPE